MRSWNATKLAFFDDPLVRFSGTLYPILVVLALARQKLCNLIDAVYAAPIERSKGKARR